MVELVIEPALFREITTVTKQDKQYAGTVVEMVDNFSEAAPCQPHPLPEESKE